jgi:hypothetical protein
MSISDDIFELADNVSYQIKSGYADTPEHVREHMEIAHAQLMAAARTMARIEVGEEAREDSDHPDAVHRAVRQGYAISRRLSQGDEGIKL